DARGGLVRRYSSDDRPTPPAEAPQIADEWLPRFEAPPRNLGLNRFVRDLRYPPPPAARYGYSIAAIAGQGPVAEPQGPSACPGGGAGDELAGLETAVGSADRGPSEQGRVVFAAQRERVAGAARRWQQVLTAELPALNARLGRERAPAVRIEEHVPDTKTGPW